MHTVKSIDIEGFRGQPKPIRLRLDRQANFIIGRNGTGKTTLVNLINAGLSLDLAKLRAANFTKMVIRFKQDQSVLVPSLEIIKSSPSLHSIVSFFFREKSTSEPEEFHFTARSRTTRDRMGRVVPANVQLRELERDLNKKLSGLFRFTWLSLARAEERKPSEDPWEYEAPDNKSDVDKRLTQSFTDLISYFSRLDGKVSDETQEFQKQWFLSFLSPASQSDTSSVRDINLDMEEKALRSIFQKFEMAPDTFEYRLKQYFERLGEVIARENDKVFDSLDQVGVLYDALRLHSLVERWLSLQDAQKRTYTPKTDFVKVASDLLFRKYVLVNRSNQTHVFSDDGGGNIPIESLSSGEKQLLIFLSETLLQEGFPHIFLADEPELSLHVEWQEELVPSLLKLNPNAQVIFATHSPDIVGDYQNNVIKMESLI